LFSPFRIFFPVLWPLLTSCRSLLLRIFFLRRQDLPGYSHILSLFACRIYRKRFRAAIGLHFIVETCPRLWPYMRFLFVRPEFCPLGDLSTPKIRLSSDSTSRWTPLPLASPSRYRADSGLSPYRTCAHRAHIKQPQARYRTCGLFSSKTPLQAFCSGVWLFSSKNRGSSWRGSGDAAFGSPCSRSGGCARA